MTIVVAFDGGARPNPGRGYGSFRWRLAGDDWSQTERLDFGDGVTSNQAEFRILIAALEKVLELFSNGNLEVFSDSELVIDSLNGLKQVRNEKLKPLWEQDRELDDQFASVKWSWHPREELVRLFGH